MEIQCLSAVCVCVCEREFVCIWMCENSANFPFRWALICVQASRGRVSAPYSTDAALERDGREGALPPLYMEVQEFPPVTGQPIFIHLTFVSFHRKSWRGGGRGESEEVAGRRAGERKSPPPSCERRWSSSSSPPSYATDFIVTTTVFSFYTHVHMNEHTLVRRDVHSQMLLARSLFKNKDGNISCANTRHMKECLHVRDTRMCCMSSRAVCMWMCMWMWMCELHIAS